MIECFDQMKRLVPCGVEPVVPMPEGMAWELVLMGVGLVLLYAWIWRRKR